MKKRIALLIDADNTTCQQMDFIMKQASTLGELIIRRVYGDFTMAQLSCWSPLVQHYALRPIQKFAYKKGKNSTDIELIMDAIHFLAKERIDGMVLVSGDSDYVGLAIRFREANLPFVVIGQENTSKALRNSCSQFFEFPLEGAKEVSDPVSEKGTQFRVAPPVLPGPVVVGKIDLPTADLDSKKLVKDVASAIEQFKNSDGYALLRQVATFLQKRDPNFSLKKYGYSKWKQFLQKHHQQFEIRQGKDQSTLFIKNK